MCIAYPNIPWEDEEAEVGTPDTFPEEWIAKEIEKEIEREKVPA